MDHRLISLIATLMVGAPAWSADQPPATTPEDVHPFAQPSSLPYRLPPFDRIKDADFMPAFEAAMREQRAEVERIAENTEPPTFENTLVALERSGRMLDRVSKTFFNLDASDTNPQRERINRDIAPRLAAHQDEIFLNPHLFARVEAVYEATSARAAAARPNADLEDLQLARRYHTLFIRAGARLGAREQARLRELNQRIAALGIAFQQNVRKATRDGAVAVDDRAELDGMSDAQIDAAAQAAKERGLQGKWLITLQNTTTHPVLAQLTHRALRERIYRASIGRCNGGDADNTAVIAEMVKLRAERARLLGFRDHASYALADEGAKTPAAVNQMLASIALPAAAKARSEAADLQRLIDREARQQHAAAFRLQPWDWEFYADRLRKERFKISEADIKPYFELKRVLHDGVFYAAHELYGLTFKERTDLPRYQPDVAVYEAFDADGSPLALLLADIFARDSKRGGAWMDEFVGQSKLLAERPVIVINLNVPKPAAGQPALLTFDETTTLFHEFGHALHGMLSEARYPLLHGTNTPPDFVEYPSQFNEMWAREPAVLAHFAQHVESGAALPPALLEQTLAAQKFGQGYATTEYLESALLDQAWHQIGPEQAPPASGVMRFEAQALQRAHLDIAEVPPRYHTPYFAHIFDTGLGYDAGYYAYLWSEVLARDSEQWFHRHGGLSRANGEFFRAKVLSRGRTQEPEELFEKFYGGPPDVGPLLEHRGLAPAATARAGRGPQ